MKHIVKMNATGPWKSGRIIDSAFYRLKISENYVDI